LLRTLAFIRGPDHLIYVTELAEGSLLDWFDRCRRDGQAGIPVLPLLSFLGDAAEALDYLHMHHRRHRNLKPSNLLRIRGRARVADLQPYRAPDPEEPVLGAPLYLAPEELQNQGSYRSNQYTLALIFLHMRTGTLGDSRASLVEMIMPRLSGEPDIRDLPEEERPPIARALSLNPENRFGTCKELVDALKAGVAPGCMPPYWRLAADPNWLTWNDGCVARIARTIDDEGRFEDLPILADALEDAGCTDATVLDHCRKPGEHVRGCFVLSMLAARQAR
jgi:serine/threonine protein kinase